MKNRLRPYSFIILKLLVLLTLCFFTYLNMSKNVYVEKGKLSSLNEIYLKKDVSLNSIAALEFDTNGDPFIWLSDGGEIISLSSDTFNSGVDLLIKISTNPCEFIPDLQFEYRGEQLFSYANNILIRDLHTNEQILITPIINESYRNCYVKGLDNRNFIARLEFQLL